MPVKKSKMLPKSAQKTKKSVNQPAKKLTSLFKDRVLNKVSKPKETKPKALAKPKLTNHVAFVIDRSGSMEHLIGPVVETFNSNLATIKEEVYKNTTSDGKSDQATTLTSVLFSDRVDMPVKAQPVDTLQRMRPIDYQPDGGTALLQAVGETIEMLEKLPNAKDDSTSFLVITLTDGEENRSDWKWRGDALVNKLRTCQATDRWSFVFLVPDERSKTKFSRDFGIPEGNISAWQATVQGTKEVSRSVTRGISKYYQSRASGQKSVSQFFKADLSKVSKKDLSKLDDLSGDAKIYQVESEIEIKPFIEAKTRKSYIKGAAFYELTKSEKVQGYKKIAIKERNGKKVYGGDDARQLLGLPDGDTTIQIQNLSTYQVFIQSTSVNRKLVRGTNILYIPALA